MELFIAASIVTGIAAVFGRLARTYPVDSRDLIAGSLVGGHPTPTPLWRM